MKRITNILSLWGILLLLVTACSDEELVQLPQGANEVELTIRTHVPDMQMGSRTAITESITSITALAFDGTADESQPIKTVNATLSNYTDTTGTLKIKVPKRTRMIHFLTNGDAEGVTDIATLKSKTITDTGNMHYWGMLTFADENALKTFNGSLTFYRNMAKVSLELGEGLTGYIAGFINYNTSGMLVPNGFEVGNTPTIPYEVSTSIHQADNSLSPVHYLFEHENVKETKPLYAIIEILDKYYKVAFANADKAYFPLIRNHQYTIKINQVDESLAGTYEEALEAEPINDAVVVETAMLDVTVSANQLNYTTSSVEDLWVTVTIPKEVTKLTFSSSDFTVMTAGDKLTATDGGYTVKHDGNATQTTASLRIRLNDNVSSQSASFTFGGTTDNQNVEVKSVTKEITLTQSGDANVRWQGNVPLNSADSTTIVPLKYEWFHDGNNFIPAGSKLNLEFTVTGDNTSWLEVFEICGTTPETDWNNPVHHFAELNDGNRYTATGNGSLSLTLSDETFETISQNFRSDFLGEGTIALAIRGAGITLTKVSVVPAQSIVKITATPATTELNYSENAVSDLMVNVSIPKSVSTLLFASEYFDVVSVVDSLFTGPTNGSYTVSHPSNGYDSTTTPVRLRLKDDKKVETTSARFTFSGTSSNNDVFVAPAVVNNITLEQSGDEYVRWQGDAVLEWGVSAVQIPLLYSWFYDANNQLIVPENSILRVEYETTGDNAEIQFAEVNGEWNDDAYVFNELLITTDNGNTMGLNLNANTPTGSIYNRNGSIDLRLTQDVLTNMAENRTDLLGEQDIVMALQGGNVRVKKISVIPATENPSEGLNIVLDFYADENGDGQIDNTGNSFTNLLLKLSDDQTRYSRVYLKATISSEEAAKYQNETVALTGTYSEQQSVYNGWAIHWDNSKESGSINYTAGNALELQFTVQQGVTEYLIEWGFEHSTLDYVGGDILFTYTITNATVTDSDTSTTAACNLSGDTQATIGFTNEPTGGGTTTPTETVVFNMTFEDESPIGGWNNINTDIVVDSNIQSNVLRLVMQQNDNNWGQLGIGGEYNSGGYTLSLKFKAETSAGNMKLVFQDSTKEYAVRAEQSYSISNYASNTTWSELVWNVTLSEFADQFVIQFDGVEANATFYIDDLKLVRTN